MPDDARAAAKLPDRAYVWAISTLLIVFTLIVAFACIVVLSVTLTQTRVASGSVEGGSVGIRKLDYVGRNWAKLQVVIDASAHRLGTEKGKKAELAERKTITEAERKSRFDVTEGMLVAFQSRVRGVDDALVDRIRARGHDVQVANISAAKESLTARDGGLAGIVAGIEKAYSSYLAANRDAVAATAKFNANEQSIKAQQEQLDWANAQLDNQFELIKAGLAIDKDARARVENAFYELNINNFDCGRGNDRCGPIGGAINRGLYHLLTFRPDLLTLLLVILMGVLGSALQITHSFFMKNQVQTIGGYFQRISVGAMTALIIFIVAKAGVPVIADSSRLGGEAPINPYFVSFLAIISGLLSENAIANVQAQGAKFFGGDAAESKRWARHDLTPDLVAQSVPIATLAEHLDVDEETAAAMIKGEKSISQLQQKIITICLRKSAREIYTDIPPAAK